MGATCHPSATRARFATLRNCWPSRSPRPRSPPAREPLSCRTDRTSAARRGGLSRTATFSFSSARQRRCLRHDAPAHSDIASTDAPGGLASFYTEGTKTANGETFNTHELTAAHPSLPFGTRLRVTNVSTGQSVTVRVNDRGPYVPGRVVDVSYSAAKELGMVKGGVAKVKLDVVQ